MSKLYIVIAANQIQNEDGTTSLIYDDSTEKFIEDEDNYPEGIIPPSIKYLNFLQSRSQNSGFTVIRAELNVEKDINVQKLLSDYAKNKLTQEELNALTEELSAKN